MKNPQIFVYNSIDSDKILFENTEWNFSFLFAKNIKLFNLNKLFENKNMVLQINFCFRCFKNNSNKSK